MNLFRRNRQPVAEPVGQFVDVSHEVFGKYQHCTQYEGVMYADVDFKNGFGVGKPKIGAIPAPGENDRTPFGQKRKPMITESEDEKRERQEREKRETNELLERLAAELVGEVMSDQPLWFEKYNEEHERDIAQYSFECRRHGKFLTLFITRNANPQTRHPYSVFGAETPERTLETTINIGLCKEIKFIPGHPPDLLGETRFTYILKSESGSTLRTTNSGNYTAPKGFRWVVHKPEFWLPHGRPLCEFDAPENERHESFINMNAYDYAIKTIVERTARAAKDDQIRFEGIGATLYAPASLGEDIHDLILNALE